MSVVRVKISNSEMICASPWPIAPRTGLMVLTAVARVGCFCHRQLSVALAELPDEQGPGLDMAKAAPQTAKKIKVENYIKHNMN